MTVREPSINETFTDINGRKHRLYTVRPRDGAFDILDRYRNMFVGGKWTTREEAWEYLRRNAVMPEAE